MCSWTAGAVQVRRTGPIPSGSGNTSSRSLLTGPGEPRRRGVNRQPATTATPAPTIGAMWPRAACTRTHPTRGPAMTGGSARRRIIARTGRARELRSPARTTTRAPWTHATRRPATAATLFSARPGKLVTRCWRSAPSRTPPVSSAGQRRDGRTRQ